MRSFLLKVLLFGCIVSLALIGMEWGYRAMPNTYSYKYQHLDTHAEEIEILALGSSLELDGIRPDLFHRPAFNAAISAQSPEFDKYIFEHFSDRLHSLRLLILPLSYTSLYQGPLPYPIYLFEYHNKWHIDAPYTTFRQHFALGTYGIPTIGKVFVVSTLRRNFDRTTVDSLGWECWTERVCDKSAEENLNHARTFAGEMVKLYADGIAHNLPIYNDMIAQCQQRGIRVILLSSPYTQLFHSQLDSTITKKIISQGETLAAQYDHVTYINLFMDARFTDTLFFNTDHLNAQGAEKLTLILDSIIENHILS